MRGVFLDFVGLAFGKNFETFLLSNLCDISGLC